MNVLCLENINTGYGKKQIVFDFELEIKKGQKLLLIGSNGSGKSTLIKSIYGILALWKGTNGCIGRVVFDGHDMVDALVCDRIKRGMMYIPQKEEVFEDLTVQENLMMSVLYLNNSKQTKKRLNNTYEQLGLLLDKKRTLASELSGGERKMLSLGMVVMNVPKLLLYDEPLSGLSGDNIKHVLGVLKCISEMGTTLIIVEHRIKEMFGFVDDIVGIRLGKKYNYPLNNFDNIKSFLI